MKKRTPLFVLVVGLAACTAGAGVPVQNMSSSSLAIDYSGLWRGEKITERDVPGHENLNLLNVRYAPLPYCLISAGLGIADYSVDTCRQVQFKGMYGFSPSLGVNLYSPFLLKKVLRFTAGVNAYYLHSKNRADSYIYSGAVVNPEAGAVFSIKEYVDIEAGVRGNTIFGRMQTKDGSPLSFSNREATRAYLSVMMHTPSEGAYLIVDFDASPDVNFDWSQGPAESAIGVSLGIILRQKSDAPSKKTITNQEYPGFKEMLKKTDDMEKELK